MNKGPLRYWRGYFPWQLIVATGAVLFVSACALPAYFLDYNREWIWGYEILLTPVACFAFSMWCANPVLLGAFVFTIQRNHLVAGCFALIALVISLTQSWPFVPGCGPGYYLWIGCMAWLAATNLFNARGKRLRTKGKEAKPTSIGRFADTRIKHER